MKYASDAIKNIVAKKNSEVKSSALHKHTSIRTQLNKDVDTLNKNVSNLIKKTY
jgi:hypothetical protein